MMKFMLVGKHNILLTSIADTYILHIVPVYPKYMLTVLIFDFIPVVGAQLI